MGFSPFSLCRNWRIIQYIIPKRSPSSQRKWPAPFNCPVQFVPQSIFQLPQNTDIQSDVRRTPRVYDAVRTGPFNRNIFVLRDCAKSATTPPALLPYSDGFIGRRHSLPHHTSQHRLTHMNGLSMRLTGPIKSSMRSAVVES
jgi:hypothetical protein